ncbi:MAG TPA: CHAD domain-containing protein, partial [Usitatibacteraceae bacterium]|nr:CHAD domain-containing protein [Usitatibacteraceae bacterium]
LPTIPSLQPGVGAGLARLRETVAAIDGVRDQAAVVEAASVRTTRIALALGQWLCAAPPAPSDGDAAAIGELWPLLLARQKKQIGKRLRQTRPDDPATFHALRIAVRKTRYAIEFFAPLQAGKVVARRLAALVKLQDVLGRINDQAIGAELVRQAAVTRPDDPQLAAESAFAAGFLTAGARAGAGQVAKLARRALRAL